MESGKERFWYGEGYSEAAVRDREKAWDARMPSGGFLLIQLLLEVCSGHYWHSGHPSIEAQAKYATLPSAVEALAFHLIAEREKVRRTTSEHLHTRQMSVEESTEAA